MSGCNLWSGQQEDRAASVCSFCDTQFVGTDGAGGGRFSNADRLAAHIDSTWKSAESDGSGVKYVVFTGGEPLLQLDKDLVDACRGRNFEIAIETNGTLGCPPGVDWICVSPKSIERTVLRTGNELKLVHPNPPITPEVFEEMRFDHFFLQPLDGPARDVNLEACVKYCLSHPRWKLSLQTHKVVGIR
jgi:7-carboxy-7-deazaguanine synthase (Cx14CxxC type)